MGVGLLAWCARGRRPRHRAPRAAPSPRRFFGLYQSTLTAMDKLGVVSEWEMHAAVPATIVGALPFLRKASRAHWPIFAALVALDRWDKYRIKERMSEEGLELGPAPSPAERQ